MKKVFLLIPLLSLFVFGCNDSQNNDVQQLALIASNKISSLEQTNKQLEEKLENLQTQSTYIRDSIIPEGTYGDWKLSKIRAVYTKDVNTNDIYITNGNIRLKVLNFSDTSCGVLSIKNAYNFLVYRDNVLVSYIDSESNSESVEFYLLCDLAFFFDTTTDTPTIESFLIRPIAIDYSESSYYTTEIDSEISNKIFTRDSHNLYINFDFEN